MSAPVPVLLVGLGGIGFRYGAGAGAGGNEQTHAQAFAAHPRFVLVAGVDTDAGARTAFSSATGVPADADLATACARLPAGARPLVVVATPTATHAALVHEALARAQPAALLCEKPLAASVAEGRALVAACEDAGVPLFVNYIRRALPGVAEVARRLRDGRIAPGAKLVAWYTKGFLHNGSHFWDLLAHWYGPVLSARALGAPRTGPAGAEIDCHLRFAQAEALLLCAWEEQYSLFDLELVAPNGRLRFAGDGAMAWQPRVPVPGMPGYHGLAPESEAIASGLERYQWHVAGALARHFDGADAGLCTGREALRTLETMTAALAAAEAKDG